MKTFFNTETLNVFLIHFFAIAITLTDVEVLLKIAGLIVALAFGVWQWRVAYLREKKQRKFEDENKSFY